VAGGSSVRRGGGDVSLPVQVQRVLAVAVAVLEGAESYVFGATCVVSTTVRCVILVLSLSVGFGSGRVRHAAVLTHVLARVGQWVAAGQQGGRVEVADGTHDVGAPDGRGFVLAGAPPPHQVRRDGGLYGGVQVGGATEVLQKLHAVGRPLSVVALLQTTVDAINHDVGPPVVSAHVCATCENERDHSSALMTTSKRKQHKHRPMSAAYLGTKARISA
jgi:hypothetical protein